MQGGKRQDALIAQSFEQQSAFVIFQSSIRPFPIQPFADRTSDLGDSQTGVIGSGLANEGQLIRRETAAGKGNGQRVVH